MRFWSASLCVLLWLGLTPGTNAASAKILKVLPHYLDQQGRHALSPSLYERDAYQSWLRKNPGERSALRFDINWKARRAGSERLLLRLELRTSNRDASNPVVLERLVRPGAFFSRWSSLPLEQEEYRVLGHLIAWRASLWRADQLLTEQKSFLW